MDWHSIPQYHSRGHLTHYQNVWENQWKTSLEFHRDKYPIIPHNNARGSLTKLSFFAALLIDVTFTISQHKNITSCFRKNKTIPVWDRWKWRLIGSLKASKILEDAWVRRFTSETYSLCESPNLLDQRMHHENWGKLKFKSSKSHARLNPGLKTQA